MKEFYTYGSEAYDSIAIDLPSRLPEEPEKKKPLVSREKRGISPVSVVGGGVVLLLFLGLLISMVQLFEIRSERAELKRQLRQLQTQQDRLITQYESGIDMDAVTRRAEELGMHIPWAEQIRYIPVEGTGTEAPGAEADGEDPEEALSGDKENQEAYFP